MLVDSLSLSCWDRCCVLILQDVHLQSRYLTEELRSIFTEDTDSENEVFEGFSSSELEANGKKDMEVWMVFPKHPSLLNFYFLCIYLLF